jgi:NADPH-ferrihemoprotein reductase
MALSVLYGSQSGVAQEVAEGIACRSIALGRPAGFTAIDDVPLSEWPGLSPIVFVCSTTGQGDVPETMRAAWAVLRRVTAPRMEGLRFAVFGLGDSSYLKYNFMAKMLHNRLKQLGAEPLVHRGLGDDQDSYGYDDELQPWLSTLWQALDITEDVSAMGVPLPKWNVTSDSETPPPAHTPHLHRDRSDVAPRKVLINERITSAAHFQAVHHIELDRGGAAFTAGDSLGIFPRNNVEDVDYMLTRLGWAASDTVTLQPSGCFARQPRAAITGVPITARNLLTHHLDISGTASRPFLRMMGLHTTDEEVQERLEELSSVKYLKEYDAYAYREKRGVAEVLRDFAAVEIPTRDLVGALRLLRPRLFSLSSAPADATFAITVGVLQITTPFKRVRRGLCSLQLSETAAGDDVECFVESGTLVLPEDDTPLILIGPGTGIAPVRCIARHRSAAAPLIIFTGNRKRDADYLYGPEFAEMQSAHPQTRVLSAFSRDAGSKIRYVQHMMVSPDVAPQVAKAVVEQRGVLYLCGSSTQMPKDVETALVSVLQHYAFDGDGAAAELFVKQMKQQGRYQTDTWS